MAAQQSHTTKQKSHIAKLRTSWPPSLKAHCQMGLTLCNTIMVPHVGNTMGLRAQVYNRATQPPVALQQLKHRHSWFTVPNMNVTWHNKHCGTGKPLTHRALIKPMNSAGEELSIGPGTWEILKTQRVLGSLLTYISKSYQYNHYHQYTSL